MSFESQIIEMPRLDKYLLSVSLSSNDNLYINCKMWLKKKKKEPYLNIIGVHLYFLIINYKNTWK